MSKTHETNCLDDLPDVLDARKIADFLNIGYVKALRLVRYGGIPYLKIGNTYRVSKKAFIAFIETNNSKVISL